MHPIAGSTAQPAKCSHGLQKGVAGPVAKGAQGRGVAMRTAPMLSLRLRSDLTKVVFPAGKWPACGGGSRSFRAVRIFEALLQRIDQPLQMVWHGGGQIGLERTPQADGQLIRLMPVHGRLLGLVGFGRLGWV